MRQISAQEKVIIPLGRQGENGAAEIIFDVSGWADLYGIGAFELLNRRPAENTPYTCSITVSDEQVHWIVQSADVALVGHGRCELTYVVDDVIAKSVVFATCVLPSIEGAGEVPEPYESRIQDLIEASANVTVKAAEAEQSADDAESSATAAAGSASDAAGSAIAADGSATAAGRSASAAAGSATAAAGSASDAAAKLALVTAEGTRQVGLITAEGTTQKNAVIEKGQEVIESIPEDYSDLVDDVEDLKSSIADVNDYALSAYVTDTASGAIATFTDGAEDIPIKSLSVAIEPVQDLHGYDNPWPGGGGKNLFPPINTTTYQGVTFTQDGNYINISGTPSANAYCVLFDNILPAGTYTFNGVTGASSDSYRTGLKIADAASWAYNTENQRIFTLEADSRVQIWLFAYPAYGTFNDVKVQYQLERGDTVTPWTPYENICPISGHTECNVTRTGVNIWDEEWETGSIDDNTGANATGSAVRSVNYIPIKPSTTYYFYVGSGSAVRLFFYGQDKAYLSRIDTGSTTFTAPNNAYYCRFRTFNAYGSTYNNDISINYPSTDTSYHTGTVDTYPITFPTGTTVYGGNISDESLVVTYQQVVIDENVTISSHSEGSSTSRPGFVFENVLPYFAPVVANQEVLANWAIRETNASAPTSLNVSYWSVRGRNTNSSQNLYLYGPYGAEVTEEQLLTMLATNPLQVVIKIYSPLTYQIETPTIHTLLGQNNIWADCNGDVSVNYRADTALYVQKKIAEALNA